MRNRACFQDTKQITRGAMRPCDLFRVAALRENRCNRVAGDAARGGGNSAFPMGTLPIRKTDTIPPGRSAVLCKVLPKHCQSAVMALAELCHNVIMTKLRHSFDITLQTLCKYCDKAL